MTDESIEILPINSDSESIQKSNKRGKNGNIICNFFHEIMKFFNAENIEEEIHADSNKFNDAIKKSNDEGKHEEIYKLLQNTGSGDSSLSIYIFTLILSSFLL